MNKKKLTVQQLIKHMKQKNITFEFVTEKEAQRILNQKNYYFKLSSYRVNFTKGHDGKYQKLDFAYLVDLASIDMQLRAYLLELSLDIEHGIKVILNTLITNNPHEDGYQIVQDFKREHPTYYHQSLMHLEHSPYSKDMNTKHHDNPSIWVFLEISSFGVLTKFVEFYFKRTNTKSVRIINNHLGYCKNFRNACAHNNPLIINLFTEREIIRRPSAQVTQAANQMSISRNFIQDMKVHDLVSLFYLQKRLQSPEMGRHKYDEGKNIIKRFKRHKEWYKDNVDLVSFFDLLNKMIDYLVV